MPKLRGFYIALVLLVPQAGMAASIEWNGVTSNDFFEESNWIITEGTIGNILPGNPPPRGTIDPFQSLGATEPIMHDLFMLNGTSDFSAGDIGLGATTGSLSLSGDALLDTMSMTSIRSIGNFGASVSTSDAARLNARSISAVELSMSDTSVVFLTDDKDPLPDGTRTTMLTTMPSPCLVFDSVDPTTAETLYMDSIGSSTGKVDYMSGNPFGSVIKSANLPEPSSQAYVFGALLGIGFLRKRI